MKNKLLMKILATLVAGVSAFSFAGCGSCGNGNDDDDSTIGGQEPPINIGGDEHTHDYKWVDIGNGKHKEHCDVDGCDTPDKNEEDHIYDNDEDTECNKCHSVRDLGSSDTHVHNYEWTADKTDETKHNGVCKGDGVCDAPNVTEDHEYDDGKDEECNKCHAVRDLSVAPDPEHDPVYKWTDNKDGETHNGTCTVANCDVAHNVTNEPHDYTDDDDATCNKCGYKREIKEADDPVIDKKD